MKVGRADETKPDRHSSLADDDLVDLFEHAVVALHFVDAQGIVVRANQAELDLLGTPKKSTWAITSASSMRTRR